MMLIHKLRDMDFYITERKDCDNRYHATLWLHGDFAANINTLDYHGEWKTNKFQRVNLDYFIQYKRRMTNAL